MSVPIRHRSLADVEDNGSRLFSLAIEDGVE
jgi:hypothetical protein